MDDVVFVHVPRGNLSRVQRRSIRSFLESQGVKNAVISDATVQIRVPSPYQYTLEQGDGFRTTLGFRTEREMVRYQERQQPGYWFDWENGESNHPDWGRLCRNLVVTDRETGEEVRRLYFYHQGTGYLERAAEDGDGGAVAAPDGSVARIVETGRKLFVEERVLDTELDPELELQSWRDRPSMLGSP